MRHVLIEHLTHLAEHPDDTACRAELVKLLEDHPELISDYIEQWRTHSLLQWSLSPAPLLPDDVANVQVAPAPGSLATTAPSARTSTRRRTLQLGGALLATAATIAIVTFYPRHDPFVGQIAAISDITWADGTSPLAPGDRLKSGILQATAGSCKIRFDSGVEMTCDGAFRLRVVDDMLVELDYGKLRASVPENARGFSVDTPDTFLIDQGTEFGVNTETGDGTQVVVFRGEVDVRTKPVADHGTTRRLFQGEAAQLLSGRGSLDRVQQVTSGGLRANWSANGSGAALFSIRDNIRAVDSLKYYNVVVNGLHEDVQVWVDRAHEWNGITIDGIPKIVRGADYAMTFNDDRYNPSFKMYVNVHRPANLYVFIDNRIAPLPDWLLSGFEDTGQDIGLDEGWHQAHPMQSAVGAGQSIDQTFSIWHREVREPAELELGAFAAPAHFGMYTLAATPLETSPPAVEEVTTPAR